MLKTYCLNFAIFRGSQRCFFCFLVLTLNMKLFCHTLEDERCPTREHEPTRDEWNKSPGKGGLLWLLNYRNLAEPLQIIGSAA